MKTKTLLLIGAVFSLSYQASQSLAQNGAIITVHSDGTTSITAPSSNTDAARGTALLSAVGAATAGDLLYLSASTYDIGSGTIDLSNGGSGGISLQGSGMDQTIITSVSQTANYQCIIPGSSCLLS